MNRIMMCVLCCAMGLSLFAEAAKEKKTLTPEERAALREKRMRKTGGIIVREGKGLALVVNAQEKYPEVMLQEGLSEYREKLRFAMDVRRGAWKFGDGVPEGAAVVVFVVDDPSLPMSLVAMEARWGVVNVAKLDTATRFAKEYKRVVIATFGAGVSQYPISPMQPVFGPEDLDAITATDLTVDNGTSMKFNLEKLGLTQSFPTTYRKACQEGWAPAPTNEYQKAVWDEVHALPTAPIEIKPETKKVKE